MKLLPIYVVQLWEILDPAARRGAIMVLVAMIFSGGLDVLGVGLILPLLQLAIDPEKGISEQPVLGYVYEALKFDDPTGLMIAVCLLVFLVYVLKNAFTVWMTYIQSRYVFDLLADYSTRLFLSYLHAPYVVHIQRNSSLLLRNINFSMQGIFGGMLMPILKVTTDIISSLAIMSFLMWLQPLVTIGATILLIVLGVVFNMTLRERLKDWSHRVHVARQGMLLWPNQAFGGLKQIKALGRESYFARAFGASAHDNSYCLKWFGVFSMIPRAVLEVLAIGGILLTLAAILLRGDELTELIPLLGVFSLAVIRVLPTVSRIITQVNNLKMGAASLETVYDDLRKMPPKQEAGATVEATRIDMSRELQIENLEFSYEGGKGAVLDDINLTIKQGESVALIGESGAGKSTLADLLLGLLDPSKGKILADDVDIASNLRGWRLGIGYIPQEAFLIDDTVRRNIALGVEDEDIKEDAVIRAMNMAQLTEVIENMPDGLDTALGEHGVRLSGGQRQRVSIARTLYNDPGILVMDEATSALDNETEQEITRSIDNLKGDKTLIIIAHRLSTVRHCDRLVLMADGKIQDCGSFDVLLDRNEKFRRMVELAEIRPDNQLDSGNEPERPELAN
ncbi:MAG: ABC transporter ATP-binding protein [Rhodospirillaceae bacterium]|jgi:ATP-binding cassette, subfamily B, bacterial PglK|nr:ABC transporter ATP-binding protein [Rhodospirillaceae bacterium]MBT4219089.1 ABC transporter ATP-binding protein [Rhodospirillaceae bacterium]MBT4464076.1 ABC transporter ATP-binding protein [Rhodospirillaceae bacterium]MBT5309520.1 ABC transporter ATP-binding protein [Rhodospirillaceae bacterium]MBT7355347.1 ABC transporter ATP-binding protein [Rhodospirillaceae bacterium]